MKTNEVNNMMDELIDSIDFSEEEYNERVEGLDDIATFNEFLENIIKIVRDNHGTIEDAVYIANDAFMNL